MTLVEIAEQNLLLKDRKCYQLVVFLSGPPGEPAGVYGDVQTATSHSIRLHWTAGTDHGSPIQYYIVEAQHQYTTEWEAVAASEWSLTCIYIILEAQHEYTTEWEAVAASEWSLTYIYIIRCLAHYSANCSLHLYQHI